MEAVADLNLDSALVEPAVYFKAEQSGVRPDANRVIFSPLVNVTVSQKRQIPFGCLALIPLTEDWLPARDIPPHARHRVHPDPNNPGTWGKETHQQGKLPTPRLASVMVNSDIALARVLQQYSERGCREIETLRDAPVTDIRATQEKIFGRTQIRAYTELVAACKAALERYDKDKLVVGTVRELMTIGTEANRAAHIYWQSRKIEIMRGANGDTSVTSHPDNFDLRVCEFAGIDVTQTEADALRAEVLSQQLQAPVNTAPTPEAFAEAMKAAIAEGVKQGVSAVMSAQKDDQPKNKNQR